MSSEFAQITQSLVHYFKSFSQIKSTQEEEVRFIKRNELKLTQVHLRFKSILNLL